MKFTILTQYYPPEIGAPQRRLSELAQRMVKEGHSVTVLTAMPNYPTGEIHDGYGGLTQKEDINGVEVIRTFIYPTKKASLLPRMTNYLSFVFSSAMFGSFKLEKSDYLMVESPPLFLGMSAFWLSRLKRTRLIFNVSDVWPDGLVRLGLLNHKSLSYRLSSWLETFCYNRATLITGQTKGIVTDISSRFPNAITYHFTNGVDIEKFGSEKGTNKARSTLTSNDSEIVILYAGLHGLAQGLNQIIDAAELLQNEQFRFVFLGDGPEKDNLQKRVREIELLNVTFLDPCPGHDIPAYLASADVILVSLKADYFEAVPSKLYEAMASEKPVLLVANSEACEIVNKYKAGIIARPDDPQGIAQAARQLGIDKKLRQELGINARRAVQEYFNRDKIVSDFIKFLGTKL
jgi:glycosyltransferase involved in cell wall biosynthesis